MFTQKHGRPIYITPAAYLTLLEGFRDLMAKRQSEIRKAIERYRSGLNRLSQASHQVTTIWQLHLRYSKYH